MSLSFAVNLIRSGIFQVLIMAAPMLLVGMAVGLIISIFQATTSIQEQTLTFVPKITAIFISLIIFGPWIFTSMVQFTIRLFNSMPAMAR